MERPELPVEARMRHLVQVAFLVSGASGLVFQVVWLRMLKLVFGVTVLATATVLSAFMAGLALGSMVFGRHADRRGDQIRTYALLELGVGLSALLLPSLLQLLLPIQGQIYRWQLASGSPHLSMLANFAICFVALLIPTTLMGGTLPVLCSRFIDDRSTLGRRVGMLYGLNTLGAVVGCIGAGFVSLWLLGETGTLRLAAGANILIGVVFLAWSARDAVSAATPSPGAPKEDATPAEQEAPAESGWRLRLVLLAFGLSGFASLGYEVAWTRILVYFVSLDTYAFSAMLAVFLMGLAAGSFVYARCGDTGSGLIRRLSLVEIGIGATAIGSLFVFSQLRHLNAALLRWEGIRTTWLGLAGLKFVDALATVFLPALLMGATFPLVSRIVASLRHKGRSIGDVYATNTIGAIAGSFVTGFVLVPLIGVQPAVVFLGGLNLSIGLMLWVLACRPARPARLAGGLLIGVLWLAAGLAAARTPMVTWTEGFYDEQLGYKLLYAKDGVAASVSVLEREDGIREVNLDGKSTAFTNYSDIQVHQFLGHLPLLVRPSRQPATVLVIGFGLGSTSWSCLQHDVERVECVELVKEEQETAAFFAAFNHDALSQPKFGWVTGDGRNHLLASDRQYDVISLNAIHPRFSPSLYTCDFYRLMRARLRDDGMACAWVTLHGLTSQEFKMLLRSFVEVFPDATLWDVNSQHLVMVAGKQPLRIDYGLWLARLGREQVRAHLREVHLEHPHAMLSHLMLDAEAMRAYVESAPLNTDDQPRVEFGHGISATSKADIFNELLSRRTPVLPLLANLPPDAGARRRLCDDMARYNYAMQFAVPGRFYYSVTHDRSQGEPLMEKALALWPDNEGFAHVLGKCSHVAESARAHPFQRWWARGWMAEREGKEAEAVAAYRQSLAENQGFAAAYRSLALALARQGRPFEAAPALAQLAQLAPSPEYARWHLALLLQRELERQHGDLVSVSCQGQTASFDRRDARAALFVAKAYSEVGLPDLADTLLRQAMADHPQDTQFVEAMGLNAAAWGRFRDAERHFERVLGLDPERPATARQLELLREHVGPQIHPDTLVTRPGKPAGSGL